MSEGFISKFTDGLAVGFAFLFVVLFVAFFCWLISMYDRIKILEELCSRDRADMYELKNRLDDQS